MKVVEYCITIVMRSRVEGTGNVLMVHTKIPKRKESIIRSWKANPNVAAIFTHEDNVLTGMWVPEEVATKGSPSLASDFSVRLA